MPDNPEMATNGPIISRIEFEMGLIDGIVLVKIMCENVLWRLDRHRIA